MQSVIELDVDGVARGRMQDILQVLLSDEYYFGHKAYETMNSGGREEINSLHYLKGGESS